SHLVGRQSKCSEFAEHVGCHAALARSGTPQSSNAACTSPTPRTTANGKPFAAHQSRNTFWLLERLPAVVLTSIKAHRPGLRRMTISATPALTPSRFRMAPVILSRFAPFGTAKTMQDDGSDKSRNRIISDCI